jgi:transposase-like protein
MPVEGVFTVEEQRALVYEYLSVPYGSKGRFLTERGLSTSRLRRWRKQVFAGTLEQGLVPRGGGVVSVEEAEALKRLLDENQQLKERLAARDAEHQQELSAKDDELAVQRRAVDALGKAIEILHRSGESKSSTDSAATDDAPRGQG